MANMTFKTNLLPNDSSYNLGSSTSTQRWNLYPESLIFLLDNKFIAYPKQTIFKSSAASSVQDKILRIKMPFYNGGVSFCVNINFLRTGASAFLKYYISSFWDSKNNILYENACNFHVIGKSGQDSTIMEQLPVIFRNELIIEGTETYQYFYIGSNENITNLDWGYSRVFISDVVYDGKSETLPVGNWYLDLIDSINPNDSNNNLVIFTKTANSYSFSVEEKEKLATIATSANYYILPVASSANLGGIKTGYTQNNQKYPIELNNNSEAFVEVPWTDTTYVFDSNYNASSNKAATMASITNEINKLNVSDITGFGKEKTLFALSETNGKISASFLDIEISGEKITSGTVSFSRLPDMYWANIKISNTSATNKSPTFGSAIIASKANLYQNSDNILVLGDISTGSNIAYYVFNSEHFRPASIQTGELDLGSSQYKWRNLYLTGNITAANTTLSGTLNVTGATTLSDNVTIGGSLTTNSLTVNGNSLFNNSVNFNSLPTVGNLTLLSALGLNSALRFIGITSTTMTDGTTAATVKINGTNVSPKLGDVIIDSGSHREYVWTGVDSTSGTWEMLGFDRSETYNMGTTANNANIGIIKISLATDGSITATTGNLVLSISSSWTTATATGPILSVTVNGVNTTATIPIASDTQSGVITNDNLTIAGIKNFVQNIRLNNAGYIGGLVDGSNRYLCLGTTDGTTDTRYIVLNSSALRPNSSVAADIDLGSSGLPWKSFYTLNNYIYNSNKTLVGRFGSAVLGTTTTNGETRFVLGNSTASGSDNNSYGTFFLYGTGARYAKITYDGLTYHTNWHIPSYGTSANEDIYFAHTGGTSAVGSNMQPVYVAENGRLTAITGALTNGSAYLTNYNHYSNSATQTINLGNDEVATGAMFHFTVKASVTGSPGVDSTVLQMNWANSGGYNSQFGIPTSDNRAFFRRLSAGTWLDWQEIAHGPLNTQVGSSTQPVYLSNTGIITQGTQYAGGTNVTLNGTPKSGNTIEIYTPITAGTSGLILISSGNGAPQWSNTTNLSDYKYWANIESTSAAKYNTEPEVKSIKITGNTSANTAATNGVVLQYDATLKVLNFVFA